MPPAATRKKCFVCGKEFELTEYAIHIMEEQLQQQVRINNLLMELNETTQLTYAYLNEDEDDIKDDKDITTDDVLSPEHETEEFGSAEFDVDPAKLVNDPIDETERKKAEEAEKIGTEKLIPDGEYQKILDRIKENRIKES